MGNFPEVLMMNFNQLCNSQTQTRFICNYRSVLPGSLPGTQDNFISSIKTFHKDELAHTVSLEL